MTNRTFIAAVFLIFSFTFFSFAQNAPDAPAKNEPAKNSAGRKKKKKKRLLAADGVFDLKYFLPEGKNSWTISLTAAGGFAGGTRLIAAGNSNGNYLCSPDQEFRNRLLEEPVLERIFDFVETIDPEDFYGGQTALIGGCMDCSYETLTIQTKKGFISRRRNSFSNETGEIKKIYDLLNDLDECR